MSPTVPTAANNVEQHKRPTLVKPQSAERRSELVCRVKYCNTLPDIPFDPKFIQYPFESTRFIKYNPTSLERNYKYEVLTEHDLGVTIDLINKDMYAADPNAVLDPADEKLLEEDILTPHDSKRSRHHSQAVSWLRRTEYISTEQTRFQPQVMDKVEAKVGFRIKKSLKEETVFVDRDSQIKAIEKTFEDAKKPIEKHYSKPSVTPVEVFPIFPDFALWKYPCAQVIFDTDPAPVDKYYATPMELMSQAMIRGVMDESGEQFVAYFLPIEETLEKRKNDFVRGMLYEDDIEYHYKIYKEYNWNVKTKASKGYEENYFLIFRQDGVYYNELETRVRLSKRRLRAGATQNNTRLVIKHRPTNASEFNIYRTREKNLLPQVDEEDEEENEDNEESGGEEAKKDGNKKDGKSSDGSGDESGKEGSDKEGSDKESEKGEKSDKEEDSDKEDGSDKENASGKEAATDKEEESGKEIDSDNEETSDKEEKSEKEDESEASGKEQSDKESEKDDRVSEKGESEKDDRGSDKDESEKDDRGSDKDESEKDDRGSEKGESDKEESDKEDAHSEKEDGGSGSEKSKGGDSDAESSASGGGGSSKGSPSSGSASSHSGSDEE